MRDPRGGGGARCCVAPCWITTPSRVDVVGLEQPVACDGALGDDPVGRAGELLDDARCCGDGDGSTVCRTTVTGTDSRATSSRMSSPSRPPKRPNHVDDDQVEAVENVGGGGERTARAANPFRDDAAAGGAASRPRRRIARRRSPRRSRASAIAWASDAVNVASPHFVGGYVLTNPIEPRPRFCFVDPTAVRPPREQLGAIRECRDGRTFPPLRAPKRRKIRPPHAKSPGEVPRPQCQADPSSRQREAV